ncbi:MAG TPA: CBS and ACT domain-containing protein [Actinomycetaceae bacterium]|nr:CBS and ACT domain-containing protein [Actinomycetaceae bacterium]
MFLRLRMTANPFVIGPENAIPEAIALMEERRIRWLPVVRNDVLVGVLSKGDIAKALPSKATSLAAGEVNYLLGKIKVGQVMSHDPVRVSPDALLEEAAVLMRDNKVEMLPVVEDDGRVVGVITESAIFDAFIEMMGSRARGTRLIIEIDDAPGVLERVGAITKKHGTNVTHLAVYGGQSEKVDLVLGLNTLNTDEIESELEAAGYRIIHRLRNE